MQTAAPTTQVVISGRPDAREAIEQYELATERGGSIQSVQSVRSEREHTGNTD